MDIETELNSCQSALPATPEQYVENKALQDACKTSLAEPKNWANIPLLNYTPLRLLSDQALVRFRGMVQDMRGPECYLERYEVRTKQADGAVRQQNGKYRDCLVLESDEYVQFDAATNVQGDRRTIILVSVPALNPWAKLHEEKCNSRNICDKQMDCDEDVVSGGSEQQKLLSDNYLLNSPIPERPSTVCMVKLYEDFESYHMHSVIDVVGFLSVDPAIDGRLMLNDENESLETLSALQAQHPPPGLVPRLHAIAVHPLTHLNPLLDARLQAPCGEPFNMLSVQKELRTLLTLCLFNDELAADYLLCHLISTV